MKGISLNKEQRNLLLILFAGVLMGALDIAIIGPALPAIKNDFMIDVRNSSWIFNIYLIAHLVAVPLFSKLSDTYGRRDIYIINILLFALGSLVIVLSNSFLVLLIGRAVQGFGAGGIFPVASAVIGDTFPVEKQGSALGLIGAVFGLAFILGPLIGGILLLVSWHLIFAINIPFAIIIIYFAFKLIPKTKNMSAGKFDFAGLVVLSIILILASVSVNSLKTEKFISSIVDLKIILPLLITTILIFLFIAIERKVSNPIINPALFSSKQLVITYLVGFGAGVAESSAMFMPLFAKDNFGLTESTASFMLLPMVLAMLVGAPVSGKLIDKKGPRFTLTIGILALFAGFSAFTFFGFYMAGFYFSGLLIGFGLAFLLGAPLRYLINRECGKEVRASGQGIVTISTTSGQILSAALLGALLNGVHYSFSSYRIAFIMLAVVSIITFLIISKLKKSYTSLEISS